VIVDQSNFVRLRVRPTKDDAPLFVDANALETFPVSTQSFEPVPWGRPEVSENSRSVDHIELPQHDWHQIGGQRSHTPSPDAVE
jgi:hypothetical protein